MAASAAGVLLVAAPIAPIAPIAPTASIASAAEEMPAACDGVTVVVDPNELGGEDRTHCVAPGTAAEAFDEAGITLEFLPIQPGFVCRVDQMPADGPCTEGSAYWSLWWSGGEGDWTYATLGVTSLDLPAGASVGFAWHEGAGEAMPPDAAVGSGVAGSDAPAATNATGDEGTDRTWLYAGVAVLVLGAATVPVLWRRRSR